MPARGPHGFDLMASVRGYIRFLKSKSRTLTDERARLVKCQADAAELNLRERTGELVERKAVADSQFKIGRRVRDSILNVPSRISGSCAAETDQHKIHVLLTRELTQALEGLAHG
jgi:phage terminase Nu1 subunit (DNA packaging protein)